MPASSNRARRAAWVASVDPLPGSDRPRASVRQFIELAVNMPEHEPHVGQAERSTSSRPSSVTSWLADAEMAVMRSVGARTTPSTTTALPASIGPPDTNTVGMFSRSAALSMPGRDLVAVRDAHQGVGAVGVDHVLDRVRDDLAAGQGVQHPAVAHGDAVVDRDGVELAGHAAGRGDGAGHDLAQVLQVDVAGHELRVRVGDGDDRLVEVVVGHPRRPPQGAGAGHVATVGRGAGPQLGHG